jgi:polyvinyl alcohol dehydrogenase (cytochrome)
VPGGGSTLMMRVVAGGFSAARSRLAAIGLTAALAAASVVLAPGGPAIASRSVTTAATAPAAAPAPARAAAQSWPVAGQNIANTRDQAAETVIFPSDVGQLAPAWTITTAGDVTATPTMVNNVLYFPDMGGMLWAVTSTGHVVWSNPVSGYTGIAGDVSRDSPAIDGDELITGDGWDENKLNAGAHVFAVNRTTGKLLWSVPVDTDPASIITGSPTVHDGVVYVGVSSYEEGLATQPGCCTFRGAVVALSAATGRILWKTYTVPSNNGGGDSNRPGYYSGGAVWGSAPVVDPATGLLYVATGNDYTVPTGVCIKPGQKHCTRPVNRDYFDAILALKLHTGAVAWGYRTIEADVSTGACTAICGPDYDFGSSPNLITTVSPATGAAEQLVGAGQKSGYYWALNPSTGKLVWRTRVGPGGAGGGILWGSATDGRRIYSAEADTGNRPYKLKGSGPFAGQTITSGSWTALNPATGAILWQTPDPQSVPDSGFVSVANGVVYAGSNAATGTNMYALDASTGAIVWSFASGGEVRSGAAIVGAKVYWGSGYRGGQNDKLYAFGLPAG